MMNLDEAIQHCEEKAKELRTEAEQLRDIGDAISNSKHPYNEPVKNCRECAEEYEQLAEWLMELKKLREENVNQFLNSKNIILSLIEENKALRKQRTQGDLADEVWKLYERYHPHLATRVIEFGDELKDLLGKYQKGGAE